MKTKIIFLDIDGVVCHTKLRMVEALKGNKAPFDALDPLVLRMLHDIQAKTKCLFVLSSRAWRTKFRDKTHFESACVYHGGVRLKMHEDWRTPYIDKVSRPEYDEILQLAVSGAFVDKIPMYLNCNNNRGWEIKAWLDRHKGEIDDYVMIDDDSDNFPIPNSHFIHVTDGELTCGLSVLHYDMIIKRFGKAL